MTACVFAFLAGCQNELVAAKALGYSQLSWDDKSGNETKPASDNKDWSELSHDERVAAMTLGFTGKTWDNESGKEKQPASEYKTWAELNVCGKFVPSSQLLHTSDWSSNTQ